jgi:hypothetical protein
MSSVSSRKVRSSSVYDDKDDASEQRSVARSIFGSRMRKINRKASMKSNAPTPTTVEISRSNSMKSLKNQESDGTNLSGWLSTKCPSPKKSNNQIVADFFDVQSLAPTAGVLSSSRSVSEKPRSRDNVRDHDTHSVNSKSRSITSRRTTGTGGNFMSFFFRMKHVVNDEVDDPEEMVDYSQFYSVDDEELTLGSGLHSDYGESCDFDDDNDDSTVVVQEKIRTLMKEEMNGENRKKKGILGRILQRRKNNKARKVAEKEAREKNDSIRPSDFLGASQGKHDYPSKERVISTSTSLHSRTEGLPRVISPQSAGAVVKGKRSEIHSGGEASGSNTLDDDARSSFKRNASCRWSCDGSIESSSSAPKPPLRRHDSGAKIDDTNRPPVPIVHSVEVSARFTPRIIESSTTSSRSRDLDIKVDPAERSLKAEQERVWRENIRREIALRSGKDLQESKENFEDDDDESVLSLLSGLLATWSAEREGSKGTEVVVNSFSCGITFNEKKSILKTSDACVNTRPRYSVAFDSIIIREYERTVGDNPSCSRGPPISIGWSYVIAHEYPIDDYELLIKAPKRSKKEFHLSADVRTHLLMEEWDCTEEDIRKARREVTYIQYCRAKASFSGVRTATKEALFLRKDGSKSSSKPINRRQIRPDSKHHRGQHEPSSAVVTPVAPLRQQVLTN